MNTLHSPSIKNGDYITLIQSPVSAMAMHTIRLEKMSTNVYIKSDEIFESSVTIIGTSLVHC